MSKNRNIQRKAPQSGAPYIHPTSGISTDNHADVGESETQEAPARAKAKAKLCRVVAEHLGDLEYEPAQYRAIAAEAGGSYRRAQEDRAKALIGALETAVLLAHDTASDLPFRIDHGIGPMFDVLVGILEAFDDDPVLGQPTMFWPPLEISADS